MFAGSLLRVVAATVPTEFDGWPRPNSSLPPCEVVSPHALMVVASLCASACAGADLLALPPALGR